MSAGSQANVRSRQEPQDRSVERSGSGGGQARRMLPPGKTSRGAGVLLLPERFADPGEAPVRFEYYDPDAAEVFLAGTFNGWQKGLTPMLRGESGRWVVEVRLPEGRHEYRLVVDGDWRDDPMSAAFAANPFGGLNAVVHVGASGRMTGAEPGRPAGAV